MTLIQLSRLVAPEKLVFVHALQHHERVVKVMNFNVLVASVSPLDGDVMVNQTALMDLTRLNVVSTVPSSAVAQHMI